MFKKGTKKKIKDVNVNDETSSASRHFFYVIFDGIFNKLDNKTQCHKLKCFVDGLSFYFVNQDRVRIFFSIPLYAVDLTFIGFGVMKSVS